MGPTKEVNIQEGIEVKKDSCQTCQTAVRQTKSKLFIYLNTLN